jgi:HEAT repeat protein
MTDDASPKNLRKFLESDDPAMRRMGLSMAKGTGVPEEVYKNVFGLSLWDTEAENRKVAKKLVKKIGVENITVFPGWLEPFEEKDMHVNLRASAATALGKAGAVEPLIEALEDLKPNVQKSALQALGKIGDERAVEPLIDMLGKENEIGEIAAEALGEIGDSKAVDSLIEALEKSSIGAANALGNIGNTRAIEPLISALNTYGPGFRRHVAIALSDFGDAQAIQPLEDAGFKVEPLLIQKDINGLILLLEDFWLCKDAVVALKKLGWKPETEDLKKSCLIAEGNYDSKTSYFALQCTKSKPDAWNKLVEDYESWKGEPLSSIDDYANDKWFISYLCENFSLEDFLELFSEKEQIGILVKLLDYLSVSDTALSLLDKLGWKPETEEQRAKCLIAAASRTSVWPVDAKRDWKSLVELGETAVEPLITVLGVFGFAYCRGQRRRSDKCDEFKFVNGEKMLCMKKECGGDVDENIIAIIDVLGIIGDARAVESLIKILDNVELKGWNDVGDGFWAETGWHTTSGFGSGNTLDNALQDSLGSIGDSRAVYPLLNFYSRYVKLNPQPSFEDLFQGKATDPEIGAWLESIVKTLVKIGKPAIEPLTKSLEDQDENVREVATVALKELGHEVE